jgi:prevent-host-death family protein
VSILVILSSQPWGLVDKPNGSELPEFCCEQGELTMECLPINITEARLHFSDLLDRVSNKGERIVLEKNKKPVAFLIPVQDAQKWQSMEDKQDAALIRKTLRNSKRRVSLKQVKRQLGI